MPDLIVSFTRLYVDEEGELPCIEHAVHARFDSYAAARRFMRKIEGGCERVDLHGNPVVDFAPRLSH